MNFLLGLLRLNKQYVKQKYLDFKKKKKTSKYVQSLVNSGGEIKVEIGAFNKRDNGWITLDNNNNCDISWDLRNGIPFPDQSLSAIYSSHLFEHLTFNEGQQLLKECKRVLKPGGSFLICVPNSALYIDAFLKNDDAILKAGPVYEPAWNNTAKLDFINYVAYMDGHHKYMFDPENLLKVIEKAGFKNARRRNFNPEIDLQVRNFESIYAEANA
jgi:predicted SAM-dependent methyltransferase